MYASLLQGCTLRMCACHKPTTSPSFKNSVVLCCMYEWCSSDFTARGTLTGLHTPLLYPLKTFWKMPDSHTQTFYGNIRPAPVAFTKHTDTNSYHKHLLKQTLTTVTSTVGFNIKTDFLLKRNIFSPCPRSRACPWSWHPVSPPQRKQQPF